MCNRDCCYAADGWARQRHSQNEKITHLAAVNPYVANGNDTSSSDSDSGTETNDVQNSTMYGARNPQADHSVTRSATSQKWTSTEPFVVQKNRVRTASLQVHGEARTRVKTLENLTTCGALEPEDGSSGSRTACLKDQKCFVPTEPFVPCKDDDGSEKDEGMDEEDKDEDADCCDDDNSLISQLMKSSDAAPETIGEQPFKHSSIVCVLFFVFLIFI